MTTAPRDLLIDPLTHDLAISDAGLLLWAQGDALARQRLTVRFRTETGEWDYDLDLGLPWRAKILQRNPDLTLIRGVIIAAARKTAGVIAVTSCEITLDKPTRRLSVRLRATTTTGTVVEVTA